MKSDDVKSKSHRTSWAKIIRSGLRLAMTISAVAFSSWPCLFTFAKLHFSAVGFVSILDLSCTQKGSGCLHSQYCYIKNVTCVVYHYTGSCQYLESTLCKKSFYCVLTTSVCMCVLKTVTALYKKNDPLASWRNFWIIFRSRQHCQFPLLVSKDRRWWGLPFWVRGFRWVRTGDCAKHYGVKELWLFFSLLLKSSRQCHALKLVVH